MDSFGILYIAMGKPYLAMALVSAESARKTNPELPICIVTNVVDSLDVIDFWDSEIDTLKYVDIPNNENRKIKVAMNEYSPFEKTVYLDCDTTVVGSLHLGEKMLNYFDVGMKLNPNTQKTSGKGNVKVLDDNFFVSDLPHWNSGIVLFRNGKSSDNFFSEWKKSFNDINSNYDQVSLVEAVYKTRACFRSLNKKWNFTPRYSFRKDLSDRDTIIIHYTSQISNYISYKIKFYAKKIDDGKGLCDVQSFIKRKRKHRKGKIGTLKYLFLQFNWFIFSKR